MAPHHLIFHKLSYLGMFLLLSGAGIYSPLPEEATLLSSGYLISIGLMNLWIAIPIAICGALIGDSTVFFLAKTGAPYAEKVRERFTKLNLERTWFFSPKHPLRAVFFMRFITGLRIIAMVYAGFYDAPWLWFLLVDFCAIVIFIPLLFAIGFFFSQYVLDYLPGFELAGHVIFIVILFVIAVVLFGGLYQFTPQAKRRRHARKGKK